MDCKAKRSQQQYNLLRPLFMTFLAYAISLAVYKYIVIDMLFNAKSMAYRSQNVGFGLHLPFALRNRIVEFWSLLAADWGGTLIGLVAIGILVSYVAAVIWTPRFWSSKNLAHTILRGGTVVGIIAAAYGPSLVLLRPQMDQPRTMVGVGVVFSCMLMHLLQTTSSDPSGLQNTRVGLALRRWFLLLLVFFSYALVVNTYSYAAAFRAQHEYENSLLTRLAYDIDKHAELAHGKDGVRVGFIGGLPASGILKNSQIRFPYLQRMIPSLIHGNWIWGGLRLQQITGYPIHQIQLENPEALGKRIAGTAMKPLFKSPLYEGFAIDKILIIRFKPVP